MAVALGLLLAGSLRAGTDDGSTQAFTQSFLEHYPRFRAEGIMTTELVGRPPYHCKVGITFSLTSGLLFSYNIDQSKNIVPYDFSYADRRLHEKIYSADRTAVTKATEIGAPTRTIFNFVWDMLREAKGGSGFGAFLMRGLMSINREDSTGGTKMTFHRRIPAGPVTAVVFTFGPEERLKEIDITMDDGSWHRIEIRKFHLLVPEGPAKPSPALEVH